MLVSGKFVYDLAEATRGVPVAGTESPRGAALPKNDKTSRVVDRRREGSVDESSASFVEREWRGRTRMQIVRNHA
jgi:hypothetical protein